MEEEADRCASDLDPKEIVQGTHVLHGESTAQFVDDLVKQCVEDAVRTISLM